MDLSSSLTLQPTSSFSSVHIVGSLISKLPSLNIELPQKWNGNVFQSWSPSICCFLPYFTKLSKFGVLVRALSVGHLYIYTHINLQDKLQCQSGDVWPKLPELTPRCHGCAQRVGDPQLRRQMLRCHQQPAVIAMSHWLKYGTWLSC